MTKAPIALFVYNRLWHARQAVEALQKNDLAGESDLFIFADAAKTPEAISGMQDVREYIRSIVGFKSVSIIERPKNLGLANSIIEGVTRLCDAYGKVIVLEDDLVVSQYFLEFMNLGLHMYKEEDSVISISGYVYPVKSELPETFFLKWADCWGWATWQRGWDLFESDGRQLLQQLKQRHLDRSFDMDGAYPYTKMLEEQTIGKNNSWAVRWYATAFLKDKLTLCPGRSLVRNIGNDGSGRHRAKTNVYDISVAESRVPMLAIPIEENLHARMAFRTFLESTTSPSAIGIMAKLKRLMQVTTP